MIFDKILFGTTLRTLDGLGVGGYYIIELGLSEFSSGGTADLNFEGFRFEIDLYELSDLRLLPIKALN